MKWSKWTTFWLIVTIALLAITIRNAKAEVYCTGGEVIYDNSNTIIAGTNISWSSTGNIYIEADNFQTSWPLTVTFDERAEIRVESVDGRTYVWKVIVDWGKTCDTGNREVQKGTMPKLKIEFLQMERTK